MRGPIRQHSGQHCRRRGFTLLELLLVTILVAVLMATAVPTFRGTLAGQQLRQAASLVSSGLANARVTAIRTGTAQQFCYEPDGNVYWVQPFDPAAAVASSGSQPTAGGASSGSGSSGQRQLASGITFSSGLGTSGAAAAGSGSSGGATSSAQETVTFFPDGTSHDATVVLVNGRGRAVSVRVRGLTGLSRVGDLEKVTAQQ
ncbi:MAG: prepilin-type N-terminal cleavage/methylation domain-containing protein [Pirellulales bacterium]